MVRAAYTAAMDTDTLAGRVRDALLEESSPPPCAWLFGSLARGTGHAHSDVDVAVLLGHVPPATLSGAGLSLGGRLEERLGREVDLIVLDRAPVDLVHRVLRDGTLLYDHDPSARVRFEVRARNEYFDLLPYLREYRRFSPDRAP